MRAHPRSRGENKDLPGYDPDDMGSSPLTRGKLSRLGVDVTKLRLIPAHAGKTSRLACPTASTRAHPRSRGENVTGAPGGRRPPGSSPLTRGKHHRPLSSPARGRLIPAHAGKTGGHEFHRGAPLAHPRSRGENSAPASAMLTAAGSSPLTRGKPRRPAGR